MDSKAAGSNVTANCKDSFSDEPSTLLVSMPAAPSASAFCIRRSSHSHDLVRDFSLMLQDEEFVDVTLVCEDGSLNAHKMFLSSYSPYFKSIFAKLAASVNKSNYPVIVLKDLPFCDLRAIVDFIYRGEVTVPQTQWKSLVKSAESLKIRGLVGLRDPDSSDVTLNNKKRRKRRKKRSASASDGKTPKDGTYECSSDASASVSDGQSVSDDADSYEGTEGDEEYDSSTQITAVQGDERNSVSTVGDVEPSNLMEQSMIVSGDASESASLCNRNSYTPNPPVGDHTGLVSQMDAMTDSMNHHANSPPIGGLLNFDQHSIHPVAGPSSGHSGLARSQGPMAAQESNTNTSTSSSSNTNTTTNNNTTTASNNNNNSNNNSSSSSHGHGHSHGTTGSRGCLHQCPYCLKRFEVRYSLIRHIRVIHNPQRHVYTCPTCGRRFAWKSAYLRHTNHCTCNKANF